MNIEQIKGKKILVVGDLMLDIYLRGTANRISPEAPVPIVSAESKSLIPGGAANVMTNLRALGCNVTGVGLIGNDQEGQRLMELLNNSQINSECILISAKNTITKTRVLANGQHVVRFDFDSKFNDLDLQDELIDAIRTKRQSHHYDAIILSDYCKGTINEKLTQMIREIFTCPIICDTKPENKELFQNMWCITPNVHEARQMVGAHIQKPTEIAKILKKELNLHCIVITLGEKGILCLDENDECIIYPAYINSLGDDPRHVFDVTGAGDTVISVLTACIASGIPTKEAVYIANIGAGIVVRKLGTATCSFDELSTELDK
jgi:rfaE bifunctional protein kinase chain/domain